MPWVSLGSAVGTSTPSRSTVPVASTSPPWSAPWTPTSPPDARLSRWWAAPATSTPVSSTRWRELARIAHERDTWFHVDGAYGGFGLLDDRVRDAYGDVTEYDSFAVDPHKWLAAPVGTGAVIVRDASVLARAFTIEAGDYDAGRQAPITSGDLGSPFDELGLGTPELGVDFSTPARGIAVWAILREIGAAGMRARVTRHLDCARRVADRARTEPDLELLIEPQLSICCFRYRPPWDDR